MPLVTVRVWMLYAILGVFVVLVGALGVTALKLRMAVVEVAVQKAKVMESELKYEGLVARVTAEGMRAKAEAAAKEAEHKRIVEETAHGWKAALDSVRADAARRMRSENALRNAGGSGVSIVPGAAPVAYAPGPDAIPAPDALAADCAETTLTANTLQAFIERVRATTNPETKGD